MLSRTGNILDHRHTAAWRIRSSLLFADNDMVEISPPPDPDTASTPRIADTVTHPPYSLHTALTNALDANDLARRRLRVEVAISPDLTVKTPPATLSAIIQAVVTHAGRVAPSQRMLVVALRRAAGTALVFTYEDGGQDRALQETALRPAQQQAALLGGSLVVDIRAGVATTVTLVLRDAPA